MRSTLKTQAFIYTLMATISASLTPLIIEFSGAKNNPLVFFTIVGFGIGCGIGVYLFLIPLIRERIFKRDSSETTMRQKIKIFKESIFGTDVSDRNNILTKFWDNQAFLFSTLGRFGVLLYAISNEFVNVAIAAIIFESRIILLVILRHLDGRKTGEKSKSLSFGKQAYALFAFSLFGILFVNVSQDGTFTANSYGSIIAFGAALLTAINIERSLKFGENVVKENHSEENSNCEKNSRDRDMLIYTLLASGLGSILSGVLPGIIFLLQILFDGDIKITDLNISMSQLLWILLYSIILIPTTLITTRLSNIITVNLEINAIRFLTPIIAIMWLLIPGIGIQRVDFFVVGATIVIAINAIFNIRVEENKFGFRWFIVFAWASGSIILYRDRIFGDEFGNSWLWNSGVDYFSVIGVLTTIFILYLSFQSLRLGDRIRKEEEMMFSLYDTIIINSRRYYHKTKTQIGYQRPNLYYFVMQTHWIMQKIKSIYEVTPEKSKKYAYKNYIDNSQTVKCALKSNDHLLIPDQINVVKEFDMLVHSKKQGRDITDPMILFAFSLMSITLILVARPYLSESFSDFVIDFSSILLSSAVAFLTTSHLDQRAKRDEQIISENQVNIEDDASYSLVDKWLPIALYFALIITFGILLSGKWFGVDEWWFASGDWPCKLFPESYAPKHCNFGYQIGKTVETI